jgi:hypothetical protein
MGWWYELRGSNGSLVMFGTSYATQEAAMRAAEITKKKMCKHRTDFRIKTGFTGVRSAAVLHDEGRRLGCLT